VLTAIYCDELPRNTLRVSEINHGIAYILEGRSVLQRQRGGFLAKRLRTVMHIGKHRPGRDRIDTDFWSESLRHCNRSAPKGRLRQRVAEIQRVGPQNALINDVDDRTIPLFRQTPPYLPREQERRTQVHRDVRIKQFRRKIFGAVRFEQRRIVDEQCNGPKDPLCFRKKTARRIRPGKITRDDNRISAVLANVVCFSFSVLLAGRTRVEHHCEALGRESLRDRSANPSRGARDYRDLETVVRVHASVQATKRVCSKDGTISANPSSHPTRRG
jgi:hypothetical protein